MQVTQHCCEAMACQVNWRCDTHTDRYDCADALISFIAKWREYGLIIHDGGSSIIVIGYCPWCGARLPDSKRDRWLDEMERRGIDPLIGNVPAEFEDDRWLRSEPDTRTPPEGPTKLLRILDL